MKKLKNLTILLCFLSLFAFISCSAEDKMGGKTPPGGETETIEEIDAKDFPTELLGRYKDDKLPNGYNFETEVSYYETTKTTKIGGIWLKDGATPPDTTYPVGAFIEKWKQTKKGGNPIKLEGEYVNGKEKYTIIYDYASKTLIGTCVHPDVTALFNGKKIS